MPFVFRFYNNDTLADYEIEKNELKKDNLHIKLEQDGWTCSAKKLSFGEIFVIDTKQKLAATVFETNHNHADVIDISAQSIVTVGRSASCDISVGGNMISGSHLELRRTADGWQAVDMGSANGTYLNGKKIKSAVISTGDVIDIGLCRLILAGDNLTVSFAGAVNINISQHTVAKTAENPTDEYPHLFKRSPRLMEALPEKEIELQAAPSIGGKPSINWISVLLPPFAMVGVMLAVSFFLGGPMTMLLFSAPMAVIGLLMSIYNYRKQCKDFGKNTGLREQKYEAYLQKQEDEVKLMQSKQQKILAGVNPPTSHCLSVVSEPARRLWERRPSDRDFMELRIGEGELPSCVKLTAPKQQLSLEEDELITKMHGLAGSYKTVAHCPITWHAVRNQACGIIGSRSASIAIAKNIIVQAATHHSYEDLRIVTIFNKDELSEWEFVKWLPHSFDDTRNERYIVDNPFAAKRVLSHLDEVIGMRSRSGAHNVSPFYLFICADDTNINHHPIMKHLLSGDKNHRVGALFLYNEIDRLPKECEVLIEAKGMSGTIYHRDSAATRTGFAIDSAKDGGYDIFARTLAPVRIEAGLGRGALTTSVSFLQGWRAKKPTEINVAANWEKAQPEKTMSVPIGVRAGGDAFLFDIHEKKHGPHGLVAGMTGFGKSEMVQSWILSMALTFSPQAVSFVLIDFKGTGLLLPFRNLPHLAGTISDLDTNIIRNLIALENELNYRKALLDEHGVRDIANYLSLYRNGKADVPLSYLFVVIDEFAEFRAQFPEFMQVVNRIFAIGRTLGVHMILLTQKPSGVVDDKMTANTRFRWCLKVASSADSNEMLRHPDAARITNPGRAFVQVGEDEIFEEIQSYWSGAPYNPYQDLSLQRSRGISVVDLYGNRQSFEPEKTTGFRSEKTEIDAIVDFLDDHTRKADIPRAKNIWANKLEAVTALEEILQVAFDGEHWNENASGLSPVIGKVDDPKTQSQYPLKLDFAEDGHVVIYGAPGMGKTTLLQTLIISTALSYTPDMVEMYLLDFGGGSLNLFNGLPHVGDVARDSEDEKVEKLCKMLDAELSRRKTAFAKHSVISMDAYREASRSKLPYIMLVLDNFAPVLNLYPDLDNFFQTITRDGAGFGIYLIATANSENAVSYRISQNIKSNIALRMPDKMDYNSIVGRTDGLEPEDFPGRGLIKGNPPKEFQTALPVIGESENQRVAKLRELIGLMGKKWNGSRPAAIPVMPDVVRAADYKTIGLLAGLCTDTTEPVEIDIYKSPFLLVSALAGGCRAELIQALTTGLRDKLPGANVTVFDTDGELKLPGAQVISAPAQFDEYVASLMPMLQTRKERADAGEKDFADNPIIGTPIIIVINDLGRFFEPADDETVKRLSNIIHLGRGLNVYLILGGHGDDISRLYYAGEAFTAGMVSKGTAFLTGGSFKAHSVFKSGLGYSEESAELKGAAGYLVTQEGTQKIKFVGC